MKYWKNLIKNKQIITVIVLLIMIIIGFIIIFNTLSEYFTGLYPFDELTHEDILTIILGLALILFGFIIPKISWKGQNSEDFTIKYEGNNIYVKFRDNEFVLNNKTRYTGISDFAFKDNNGKFVGILKAYQIANFVNSSFGVPTKNKDNVFKKSDVFDKFKSFKPATQEDILMYTKQKNIKNHIKVFPFIVSLLLLFIIIICIIGAFETWYSLIIGLIILPFWYITFNDSLERKRKYKKINNSIIYVIDCHTYDIGVSLNEGGGNNYYYVKVTDGTNHLNKTFEISKAIYYSHEKEREIPAKLLVSEDGKFMDVIVL